MVRKGKFRSGHSFKRPYFVERLREGSNKYLKQATNRKLRRMPLDSVNSGCAYKRLIEVWDYNGDLPGGLHHYCHYRPSDVDDHHVKVVGGVHYFPK